MGKVNVKAYLMLAKASSNMALSIRSRFCSAVSFTAYFFW
jgi:hypothetical protein